MGVRFFRSIQFKIILIYVLLILIAMQLIGVYFVRTLETSFKSTFSDSIKKQAFLLAEYVEPYLKNGEDNEENKRQLGEELGGIVNNLFNIKGAEIQVIDANGTVLTTSLHQSVIGQKNTRTEVTRALQGIKDNETDIIDSDGNRKKIVAMPVMDGAKVIGAIYIVASMEELLETLQRINRIFVSGTLIALTLTGILGIILSHTITNPIKEITKQVKAVAKGNLNQKVKVLDNDEIGQLSNAFNEMTNRLQEALSANEEEKEKLASILANMSDGVIAANDQGEVIVINRRAGQMLNIKEKEAFGKPLFELLGMDKATIADYISGKENTALLKLPTAEEGLTVRITFTPIHRRGKGITGTIAVLQDVTEQEKLEQSRKEFVANVSHELRTPLTTFKSYLEALSEGAVEDAALSKRFIAVMQSESERMIRLVNDLLQLSRLDSKQAPPHKERVDIVEMLDEVADRFSFQLKKKKMRITTTVEKENIFVFADRDQIDQVLDNLLSNAIKFTPEGGHIHLKAENAEDGSVRITVQDTGIGIPKKDLERIFDRFYRVDKARSRNLGGTGLGLSIAREIIKAHGGTILLDSEPDKGTVVTFYLPSWREGGDQV